MSTVDFSDMASQARVVAAANDIGELLQSKKLSHAEAMDALTLVLGFAIDTGWSDRKQAIEYVRHMLSGCVHCEDEEGDEEDDEDRLDEIPDEEFFHA